MSQSASVRWAPFYGPGFWSERDFSHIPGLRSRGSVGMSEQPGLHRELEWQMPKWLPTVALSVASGIFAAGMFYAVSLSKWDRFDDADRRLHARVLKLEESVQAMENGRAKEYAGLKISVGRIISNHVSKLSDKLDETMRQVAVRTEATTRFENEMRRILERMRDDRNTP